ncbi:exosome-associated protein 1 [Trypanosoma rangeli]|uniref:Exosome-associated protein 1 n=1 Tax=Trypanosoma rangeli TaxID=5698 RepID=A0A3R7M9T9_TRYRA|nr:exosome-associated protein 1 [Trypanosoma rangeli]RNF02026.1 exosome-associated protein 1 [Trypanosoma rangeli]|eukprot:RNF02026.1 exosome-associated protein 1 [Trypanosoma rangeli]
MLFSPAISEAEIQAVQDGVANDVRSDGRTLTQRRSFTIRRTHNAGASLTDMEYDGSCVEVQCGGTTVVAAATPSVVEVGGRSEAASAGRARGPLFISIDAVPAVVDYYAQTLRNRGARYRHAFLSFVATTVRQTFGAAGVTVREQLGVAEAERLDEGENAATTDDHANDEGAGGELRQGKDLEEEAWSGVGFPGEDLYIGGGYAFRTDVDVHVLQTNGGNLPSIISLAVHAALKSMRLPCVTLHEASGGVSLEVDRNKPFRHPVDWSRLPVLTVLLISPTRHYVVDPTPLEELALPQQLHLAVNAAGQVCYMRYQQLPSRRGNAWRLGTGAQRGGTGDTAESLLPTGINVPDLDAVLHDVPYICQAIISECDEALHKSE